MINGSQAFNNAVDEGGYPYKARLKHEGTIIDCDISSCKIYKGSTGNDVFSIGSIYIPYIEIEAVELTTPVYGKELKLEVGVVINEEQTEWISIGYFTVSKASSSTVNAKFTAVGRIAAVLPKVQVSVTSSMTPAELIQATQTAVREAGYPDFIIDTTGVTLSTSPITDLSNTNAQQIIEILAGVVGAYATEDNNGNVVLFRYDTTNYIEYDGSRMTQHPVTNEEDFELINIKVIKTEEYEQDDGTVVPEVSFVSGEPYEWVVMNSNMTAGLFPAYCQNCLGLSYRPATINFAYGDPRLEAKDVLQITDVDDTVYLVPCMTLVHDIAGGVTTEITAPHEGEGEIDSESEMGGKGPITQQIDAMGRNLMSTQASAAQAKTAAVAAQRDAQLAESAARGAERDAASASRDAASASRDAASASREAMSATSSANTALMGLSQVESVIDALNWIASHGTYTKATTYVEGTTYYTLTGAVEPSPYAERKYYVLSGGIYVQTDVEAIAVAEPVVGDIDTYYELLEGRYVLTEDTEIDPDKTYYTISDTYYITTGTPVSIPKPEDISLYYTLNVRDAIGDYVQTHLAVTNDGLYVMADRSEWKVLIANDGVYIINPEGENVAKYKDTITIGKDDGSEGAQMLDYHSLQLFDQENMTMIAQGDIENAKPYFYVSDLRPRSQHIIFSNVISNEISRGSYYTLGAYYRIKIPETSNVRLFIPTEDRIDFEYSMDGVLYKANNKDFKFYKDARYVSTRNSSAGQFKFNKGIRFVFYDKLIEGDTYVIKYYTNEKSRYDFTTEYEISHTVTTDEANTYSFKIYHPVPISASIDIQLKSISYNGALLFGLQRTSNGVLLIVFDSVLGTSSEDMRTHYSLCTADFDIYSTKLKALTFGNRQKNSVLGSYSVSIGENNVSAGKNSLVMGDNAKAFGDNSIVIGDDASYSSSNMIGIVNKDETLDNPSIRMSANNGSLIGDINIRFSSGYESEIRSIEDVDDFSATYRSDTRLSQDRKLRIISRDYFLSYKQYKGTVDYLSSSYDPGDGSGSSVSNTLYIYKGVKMGSSADDRETYIGVRTRSSSSFTGGTLLAALDNKDLYISGDITSENAHLQLDTTATSGVDKEIYDALVSLGWDSDVIV